MTPEEKLADLEHLSARMCATHCWRDHRHVPEPFDRRRMNEHVAGAHRYGLCPIAPGEAVTRVALLDFDSHKGETSWEEMLRVARGVADVLKLEGYEPVMWRSSGGQGIHLYLLWDEPQDAYSVREMLRGVLAACDLENGTGGVAKGHAEIFPKADEVPPDGSGSMFVLPHAGKSERLE